MDALRTYFAETGENPFRLAKRMGRAPATITQPLNGKSNPSVHLAQEIEKATEGRVSALEFLSICLDARSRAKREAA